MIWLIMAAYLDVPHFISLGACYALKHVWVNLLIKSARFQLDKALKMRQHSCERCGGIVF